MLNVKHTFRKSPKAEKAGKKPRVWELGGTAKDLASLERTKDKPEDNNTEYPQANTKVNILDIIAVFVFPKMYNFNFQI